ncbi:origin recognition complex subunit 2-domain-containing protein [Scheffersomyces amazonensis]|uniref:origin recognition complex subunit 2-domain-containing protein n=1 Tax=Scheffersomyces amazonensis TaxID=1078765 RepID=UPI00315DDD38
MIIDKDYGTSLSNAGPNNSPSTPRKSRSNEESSILSRKVIDLSPQKSPGKRGIIKLNSIDNNSNLILSPVKTPNGRAGLISPQKRSMDALNRSARKKAVYARLMDEVNESDDEPNNALVRQEMALADIIINKSRNITEDSRGYGSDVEFEEDLTLNTPKTRTRTRTRQRRISYKGLDDDLDSEDSDDKLSDPVEGADISSNDESLAKSNGEEDEEEEVEEEEEDDDDDEDVFEAKKARRRRGSPQPRIRKTSNTPVSTRKRKLDSGVDSNNSSPTKAKVGRPTKSDGVIKKIKSIFQQDDELIFNDNADSVKSSPAGSPIKTNSRDFSNISDGPITIPVITGIEKIVETESKEKLEFEPLPIPTTDSSGKIIDKVFLNKYFSGKKFEEITKGRFLDEKAFFLEGSEGYFEQHSGRTILSNSSLSQLAPHIDYSQFIPLIDLCGKVAKQEKALLERLHKLLYHQWCFELSQGFNILFYGVGSKITLINDFVQNYFGNWYSECFESEIPTVFVINGFNPSLSFKAAVHKIVSIFTDDESSMHSKIPKHVSETVPFLINYLSEKRSKISSSSSIKPKLILVIHNIDGKAFRDEKTQNLLSQLCAVPEIWTITSVDNINSPLLWDSFKLKNYNFIWHDLTTYASYSIESSFGDVLSMGRTKKLSGDSGTKYVLSSLTSNHRNLYRILLEKQIEILDGTAATDATRNGLKGNTRLGVDMKQLYEDCVEQFITSDEINFRTLLGEYVEHKMCKLVKDEAGVEIVFVPFRYDEMQKIRNDQFAAK